MAVITWTKPKVEEQKVKAEMERLQGKDKQTPICNHIGTPQVLTCKNCQTNVLKANEPTTPVVLEQCAHISRCGSQGAPNATIDGKPAYVCKVHVKKMDTPNVVITTPAKPRNTGGNTAFLKAYWAYRKEGGQMSMKDWAAKEKEKVV